MASYKVRIKPSAVKELESVPLRDRRRLVLKIRSLAGEARPAGCEKLSGQELYRVRQGHYRVLYSISDPDSTITVIKIGHRRDVYR